MMVTPKILCLGLDLYNKHGRPYRRRLLCRLCLNHVLENALQGLTLTRRGGREYRAASFLLTKN